MPTFARFAGDKKYLLTGLVLIDDKDKVELHAFSANHFVENTVSIMVFPASFFQKWLCRYYSRDRELRSLLFFTYGPL
jgi:hypothetical protein